jgi:hypothetical protein
MNIERFGPMAEADHEVVCECRNNLADALKVMLQAGYMTTPDWLQAQRYAQAALGNLAELIRMHAAGAPR